MKISIRSRQRALCLAVITLLSSVYAQRAQAQDNVSGKYTELAKMRVGRAIASGAAKDIRLAEASLCGLGWLALYGNGDRSRYLAQRLNSAVTDAYNKTERMRIYTEHTNEYYTEMLNLRRFRTDTPVKVSPEYIGLTRQRVDEALDEVAGQKEFRLAEGSLCALGWLILYGNDSRSRYLAKRLESAAARAWPRKDGIYMQQSSEAYAEIMNLGRFTDKK